MADEETTDTAPNEEEPKWLQTLMNKIDSIKPQQAEENPEIQKVKLPLIPDPIPDVPDEDEELEEEPAPPKKQNFLNWLF